MGKAKCRVGEGHITIEQEGTIRKFRRHVEQITFSGRYIRPDQEVLYVTERCVFRLEDGKMTIIEVAPGISIERDILPHMDFVPVISPAVRTMDERLFCESWGALGETIRKGR